MLLRKLAPTLRTPLLHRCRLAAPPSFPIWLPVPLPLPTFASGHSPHQPTPAIFFTHTTLGLSAISLPLSSQINLGVDVTCCRWTRLSAVSYKPVSGQVLSGALYTNSTTASSLVTHLYYDCQPFGQNNSMLTSFLSQFRLYRERPPVMSFRPAHPPLARMEIFLSSSSSWVVCIYL